MRNVIQFNAAVNSGNGVVVLTALCNDGTMWRQDQGQDEDFLYSGCWRQVEDVPQGGAPLQKPGNPPKGRPFRE